VFVLFLMDEPAYQGKSK